MAIEYFDGFEAGLLPGWAGITSGNLVAGTGRFGYGLRNGSGGYVATLALAASSRKTVGFAYSMSNGGGYNNAATWLVSFWSGGVQHLTVNFSAGGNIVVRLGNSSGTVLATSTQIWTQGVFLYVEVQATIADSGGTCIIKVDGTEWVNFTGDTKNAGTSTTIDQLSFGTRDLGTPCTQIYDDMYVLNETDATATTGRPDNTFIGDVKVVSLLPNGNGATSQWVGSDADSVNNYLLVDEDPPNTTDYVGSPTDGNRDLWTLADIPANTITVYGVLPSLYAIKSDAGAASLKILHRDNAGTVTAGSTQPLSTSWGWYRGPIISAKPSGGAWTVAEINALQLGVEKA